MRLEVIILLSVISIGILIGVLNYKKSDAAHRALLFLLTSTFIAEYLAEYAAHKYKHNLVVYHLFNPVEYCLFAICFFYVMKSRGIRIFILASLVIYVPLSLYNSFYIQPFSENKINSNSIIAESIMLVLFSLLFLYQVLRSNITDNIYRVSFFWANAGILLFFATNVFFWGFYNKMIVDKKDLKIFYKILFYENVVLYGLCAVDIWLNRNRAKS